MGNLDMQTRQVLLTAHGATSAPIRRLSAGRCRMGYLRGAGGAAQTGTRRDPAFLGYRRQAAVVGGSGRRATPPSAMPGLWWKIAT